MDKKAHRNGYNKEGILTSMIALVEGSLPEFYKCTSEPSIEMNM